MERTITVPRGILKAIEDHARAVNPEECCGLLSGNDGAVDLFHPLRNNSSDPKSRYFASPEDLFEAMREMRSQGRNMLAIYHSHPNGSAYPSQIDIELAFYPHVAYLIQTLAPEPVIRAFRIEAQTVSEIGIEVVEREWREVPALSAAASAVARNEEFIPPAPAVVEEPRVSIQEEIVTAAPTEAEVVELLPVEVVEEIEEILGVPAEPVARISETQAPGLIERIIRRVRGWL